MIPRGEVGLIFATIGLDEGILGKNLYAALLLVVLLTTLMTPPLLRWRLTKVRPGRGGGAEVVSTRPPGGWVQVTCGSVDLVEQPPSSLALEIALDAVRLMTDGVRPGARLLDWIGQSGDTPLQWSPHATRQLFAVLTEGDSRALRFLDTTGVLERALPELAAAVDRRRRDPFLLDPAQVLHFYLVEQIRLIVETDPRAAAEHAQLQHPEWLLLAALILDSVEGGTSPVELARRIAHRLDLGATAEQQIALVVGDADLLLAAARKVDALDEERALPVAIHLDNPERARALYVLSVARGELAPWDRGRLDELFALVMELLAQPDVTGLEARNLLERRRAEASRLVGEQPRVVERIRSASRAYVLSQSAEDFARQAAFVDPVPGRDDASVAVHRVEPGVWRIEVAARDRPGLLAAVAGAIAAQGLGIVDAVVTTWPDGAALSAFLVRSDESVSPDPVALEAATVAAFGRPFATTALPEASLRFDDHSSPWYTICEVRSPDRRGLLQNLGAAMASAGVNVHAGAARDDRWRRRRPLRAERSKRAEARRGTEASGDGCRPRWGGRKAQWVRSTPPISHSIARSPDRHVRRRRRSRDRRRGHEARRHDRRRALRRGVRPHDGVTSPSQVLPFTPRRPTNR